MVKRAVEDKIRQYLFLGKVVIVYGARQVGKTTLVKQILADYGDEGGYINCDELRDWSRMEAANNSDELLEVVGRKKLVVIDEAQRVPNIGLKLKLLVDNYPEIQIIATGSSSFDLANEINEPLTGRNFEFWLYPLTIEEIIGKDVRRKKEVEDKALIYGLYPGVFEAETEEKRKFLLTKITSDYLFQDTLKFEDIKASTLLKKLLQALALQIGNEVSFNELATLLEIGRQRVEEYVTVLEKAFIIFKLSPFSRNLRQELNKKRKIYFYDLGVRNALVNNLNPLNLRDDKGKLWENLVVAERIKKHYWLVDRPNFYYWRTYQGQEIDLVEDIGGKLAAWEIKWERSRSRAPKAWTEGYPGASWQAVTRGS